MALRLKKIAAVNANEDIFVQICARVGPALNKHVWDERGQVAFFSAHDEIGTRFTPIASLLLARYDTPEKIASVSRAVRLSHECEFL